METWSSRLGVEHRASNPVSIKNVNAAEISATASDGRKLLTYVPARTKRTRARIVKKYVHFLFNLIHLSISCIHNFILKNLRKETT
jgi:hypothetical protein